MAINISPTINGSTTMGCFIICVDVQAATTLQETAIGSNQFQFLVNYSYSGTASGSGSVIVPVSGNTSGQVQEADNVVLGYSITNWTLTNDSLSCNLTASISHDAFPDLGPDYIYNNVQFSGPLPSTQAAKNNERIRRAKEIDAAFHKATGVDCSLNVPA